MDFWQLLILLSMCSFVFFIFPTFSFCFVSGSML